MGRISANPETFTEGGLIDDFDGIIIEARTNLFTYPGSNVEIPALRLLIGHGEGDAERHEQQYSAGDLKNFVPSEDQLGFDQVGDRGYLVKTSNLGMLLSSLVAGGFPKALLDAGEYNVLDGTRCHFMRQVQQERKGLANPEGAEDKKKGPRTILLVSEVKELPGGKKATAPKPAAAAKPVAAKPATTTAAPKPAAAPAAAAPAADAGELEGKLQEFLMEKLVEVNDAGELARPDGIKKKELLPLVMAEYKTNPPMRNFGVKRVVQQDFLAGGPWQFADDVLTAA